MKKITPKMRRAARAVANCRSYRDAAKTAGLKSKRALAGVTIAEWMRDPDYRQLVATFAEESMSGREWEARNALMARGLLPTRYEWDGQGRLVRAIGEAGDAIDRQGKALGKYKDGAEPPVAPGAALGAFLGVEPAKLATLAEAAAAVLRSGPKRE